MSLLLLLFTVTLTQASGVPVDHGMPANTNDAPEQIVEPNPDHTRLSAIWQRNARRYGDTSRARQETIKEIRALNGVKDAGLSPEQSGIWVRFKSGSISGIMIGRIKPGRE